MRKGESFLDVISRRADKGTSMYVELSNSRLAEGVVINTQDVVRAQKILYDFCIDREITFNASMSSPMRMFVEGDALLSDTDYFVLALEGLVKWFDVVCYFTDDVICFCLNNDMTYRITTRGKYD